MPRFLISFLKNITVTCALLGLNHSIALAQTQQGSDSNKSYALVIGIEHYNNGWDNLEMASKDANAVAETLKAIGFKTTKLISSKTTPITGKLLKATLEDFLVFGPAAEKGSRVLIWYAGHSYSTVKRDTENYRAYLVGSDAPIISGNVADGNEKQFSAFQRAAVPFVYLSNFMTESRAHHVLMVLDTCFSGSIFKHRGGYEIPPNAKQALNNKVRQFITAGTHEQKISEGGAFRKLFMNVISGKDYRADLNQDGFILGRELGQFLRSKITTLSGGQQTPLEGTLSKLGYGKGNFVFKISPSSTAEDSGSRPKGECSMLKDMAGICE